MSGIDVIDDVALTGLATRPARPMFPVLRRAAAMWPLSVLAAVLPGLYALFHRSLDDAGARWALGCLQLLSSGDLLAWIDPDMPSPAHGPVHAPGGVWWTAFWLWAVGPAQPIAPTLGSYLAVAAAVGMVWKLTRTMGGARFALLATVLAAVHVPLLHLAQNPAPEGLALFFALVAMYGFLRHLDEAHGLVSLWLLAGGIATGFLLLTGGALTLLVAAVLLVFVLLRSSPLTASPPVDSFAGAGWSGWNAAGAWLVQLATGFAVGGWWLMMMVWQHGARFWWDWLGTPVPLGSAAETGLAAASGTIFTRLILLAGPLPGLALYGLYAAARGARETDSQEECGDAIRLLPVWGGLAALLSLPALMHPQPVCWTQELWPAFLSLALVVSAAYGLLRLIDRNCPTGSLLLLVVLPLGLFLAVLASGMHAAPPMVVAGLLLPLALFAAGWWSVQRSPFPEHSRHWLTGGLLAILLCAHVATGLLMTRCATADDRTLIRIQRRLSQSPFDVYSTTLISRVQVPPQLQFVMQAAWPRARFEIVENWDMAVSRAQSEHQTGHADVVAYWGTRDVRPEDLRRFEMRLRPLLPTAFYQRRQVAAFLLVDRDAPLTDREPRPAIPTPLHFTVR